MFAWMWKHEVKEVMERFYAHIKEQEKLNLGPQWVAWRIACSTCPFQKEINKIKNLYVKTDKTKGLVMHPLYGDRKFIILLHDIACMSFMDVKTEYSESTDKVDVNVICPCDYYTSRLEKNKTNAWDILLSKLGKEK